MWNWTACILTWWRDIFLLIQHGIMTQMIKIRLTVLCCFVDLWFLVRIRNFIKYCQLYIVSAFRLLFRFSTCKIYSEYGSIITIGDRINLLIGVRKWKYEERKNWNIRLNNCQFRFQSNYYWRIMLFCMRVWCTWRRNR